MSRLQALTAKPARTVAPERAPTTRDRRPKLAEELARSIEKDIIAEGWHEGRLIGNEADLVARYGASRWTVREAIRILDRDGLARMRRGCNGGLVAASPGADAVVEALRNYLEFSRVTVAEIVDARAPIEKLVVALATQRIDAADSARLRSLAAEVAKVPFEAIPNYGMAMVRALRESTRNVVLGVLANTLGQLSLVATIRSEVSAERFQRFYRDLMRARVAQVDAIVRRAAGDAGRIEREHLRVSREMLLASAAHTPRNKRALVAGRKRVAEWLDSEALRQATMKRSELLALQLHMEIVASGSQPGAHLGSEPELVKRYGISRAVFREAVRYLERFGAVEMRRGGDSGLKIGSPDPAATIRTAQIFLTHCSVTRQEVAEAGAAVDHAAAMLAARRPKADREDAAARLRDIAATEVGPTLREQAHATHQFHLALAAACGNHILELFMRILAGIARPRPPKALSTRAAQERATKIRKVQIALADAIGIGNETLAARRMAQLQAAGLEAA